MEVILVVIVEVVNECVIVMLFVCKYVCEKGVDIYKVVGIGKNGCIVKVDIDVFVNGG